MKDPEDREITSTLYGGDIEMRIKQEILIGIGGVKAVRKLGYNPSVWHMNEGHAAFLGLERIRELVQEHGLTFQEAIEAVRAGNVFTTHTPVPAGNDVFSISLIDKYFGDFWPKLGASRQDFLNLGLEKKTKLRRIIFNDYFSPKTLWKIKRSFKVTWRSIKEIMEPRLARY